MSCRNLTNSSPSSRSTRPKASDIRSGCAFHCNRLRRSTFCVNFVLQSNVCTNTASLGDLENAGEPEKYARNESENEQETKVLDSYVDSNSRISKINKI